MIEYQNILMMSLGFLINWSILYLLIESYGLESAIAQLFGTFVVACYNFICLKFIVYMKF